MVMEGRKEVALILSINLISMPSLLHGDDFSFQSVCGTCVTNLLSSVIDSIHKGLFSPTSVTRYGDMSAALNVIKPISSMQ